MFSIKNTLFNYLNFNKTETPSIIKIYKTRIYKNGEWIYYPVKAYKDGEWKNVYFREK